ncbi:phosphate ABC transporter substrate-binding protein, PhoT family [Albimonas donghaensis]|uniref:Phosphate ABC transporter substrate-binding protein, PhoT family n=1 Tax=Albimonas donghaensis TaxID=356660 RepID=A0A1H2QDB5_9RHOB|nr:substrate-binding domain-containing protein [Albimonas donghaensis]SDW05075.1 phosphate ABC transporter substrate-binding protein, PhoT family [Albimonas donghaensis]
MTYVKLAVSMLAIASASTAMAQSRDQIRIVGSSTVFPYTQAVAEQFSNTTGAPSPIVESTGTGGGMQIFCQGIGEQHPDVTGASRAMKPSEYKLCQDNGVESISEAMIGYDGLSLAVSRESAFEWDLTLAEVYLALAAQVPVDGEWADNPYTMWNEINADLPAVEILAYGPPPTSGTRDAFVELAMHAGCEELDYVKNGDFDGDWIGENCSRMRTDGPFVEAGENDNLIVQRLQADANAVGIFGYSFLYENMDTLKAVDIAGVSPSEETIGDFSYPVSRPLFFYVKNAHRGVIPNLDEFIAEYMSDDALEPGGYLSERGLVSLSADRLTALQDAVLDGAPMSAPE